ncbi:MAG: hypothetical protein DMG88_11300 [Acidobacteria bacterium]|nr:MAG: hypothetical protein DMG88_11300 [Acidobacteriota bacterium]
MENQLHLTFGECLIVICSLIVFYWMSRAPKSLLQLLGFGTETDRTWLVSLARRSGKFFFFCLLNVMLLSLIPSSMTRTLPGSSLIAIAAAIAISVLVLRKPRKA